MQSGERESKVSKAARETEATQRRKCKTLGALKDDLNKISASRHPMSRSLSAAVAKSSQQQFNDLSNSEP